MARKLIFLDIDGTLSVPFDRVPHSAKRACAASRQAGNLLFLCTGRALTQISPKITRLGFDGIVSSGGAEIYLNGRLVRSVGFTEAALGKVRAFLDKRRAPYVCEGPGCVFPGPYLFDFYDSMARESPRAFLTAAFARHFWRSFFKKNAENGRGTVCKVVFMSKPGGSLFAEAVRELGADAELFENSIPGMSGGEISPKGVHKGAAVEFVAAHYGAARESVFAFGDGDNDRTMLTAAGHGIAMGNACGSLKALASDVTDRVDRNGLAKAFEKWGLSA